MPRETQSPTRTRRAPVDRSKAGAEMNAGASTQPQDPPAEEGATSIKGKRGRFEQPSGLDPTVDASAGDKATLDQRDMSAA